MLIFKKNQRVLSEEIEFSSASDHPQDGFLHDLFLLWIFLYFLIDRTHLNNARRRSDFIITTEERAV